MRNSNYPHIVALECDRVTYGNILIELIPTMGSDLMTDGYSDGWHDYGTNVFQGTMLHFKKKEDATFFILTYGGEYIEKDLGIDPEQLT
jgi:hypothetical protein